MGNDVDLFSSCDCENLIDSAAQLFGSEIDGAGEILIRMKNPEAM
jgi:hypothetical protein